MRLRASLLTGQALRNDSWKNTEWFGVEDPYLPYCVVDDWALAYGEADVNANVEIEVYESFEYICVYKNHEFVASFEFPFIPMTGQIITFRDFKIETAGLVH